MVKCLTFNLGVMVRATLNPLGFFMGVSLGKTLQIPSTVLVKPRKDVNNMSFCHDMTEILLKALWHKHHSINQYSFSQYFFNTMWISCTYMMFQNGAFFTIVFLHLSFLRRKWVSLVYIMFQCGAFNTIQIF